MKNVGNYTVLVEHLGSSTIIPFHGPRKTSQVPFGAGGWAGCQVSQRHLVVQPIMGTIHGVKVWDLPTSWDLPSSSLQPSQLSWLLWEKNITLCSGGLLCDHSQQRTDEWTSRFQCLLIHRDSPMVDTDYIVVVVHFHWHSRQLIGCELFPSTANFADWWLGILHA